MPLIIITGYPSSGKTRRSVQLKNYFQTKAGRASVIVADESSDSSFNKNVIYADSRQEKEARGRLKSEMQRLLNRETIVILDSINYIKGCRYELYCASKLSKTTQLVLHCDTSSEVSWEWNNKRPPNEQYEKNVFDGLVMRYEMPDSRNRWDSPLFTIQKDDELDFKVIEQSLLERKPPPPNQSTQNAPLSSANFLYELDTLTQAIVKNIIEAQKTAVPGEEIKLPGAIDRLLLTKKLMMPELTRIRRQFVSFTKTHPIEDTGKIPNMFVQYINSLLGNT